MKIETYEQSELDADCQPECEAEAVALIEQLGLKGQKQLLKKKSDGETGRIPYRQLTIEEAYVYRTLLTKETCLREYGDAPIPLRVLQVAAHAKELFDEVQVLSAPTASDLKDPVLIGVAKRGHEKDLYLLARWGEEL